MRRGLLACAVLAIGLAGCGSSSGADSSADRPPPPLTGAGSKQVVPLMARWEPAYERESGERIAYRALRDDLDLGPVSSGAVEFGVADAPITPTQYSAGGVGIAMIPWLLSGIAVVYDVKGVPDGIHLNSDVLVGMLLGDIRSWDDPAIARLNHGVDLPATPVTPVFRSDESGEGYVLTDYLTVNSAKFRTRFGIARNLRFPAGVAVRGKSAVSAKVARTDGAIGYVDLPHAVASGLDIARIENTAGNFLGPTAKALTAGAEAGSRRGPNNEVWLKELPASAGDAYPLVTFSYAVVPLESERGGALRRFLTYGISPAGQAAGRRLHFAPLPPKVVLADKRVIAGIGY